MNKLIDVKTLPSVCPLDCPDCCSLSVEVEDSTVIAVKGSMANPYTDGVICNKVARYYPDFVHGERRLRYPMKRIGPRGSGEFERISWVEALDLVYEGFSQAIEHHGPQSVMPLNYSGPHGELAGASMDRRFFYYMGATLLNRGPFCGAVRGGAYASLFGNSPGMPPEQAEHADLIVVWGNNVTVSNLHLTRVIKEARAKGTKVVIIDPKRIKVAEQCDLHIQPYPGTDVVLAMAIAAELERRDALDHDFIAEWTLGFAPYMEQARQYSIVDVETVCRVSAEEFNALVDLYTSAETVAASFGNGIERGHSGGSGLRAGMALQALLGSHGRLGAGVIAKSGVAAPKTQSRLHREDFIPAGTRTFNLVDVPEKLLDDTLDPPVKAIMIYNHNAVATHPHQKNMIKALMREDLFIVGADIEMNDSMAYADVILPAASHFESDDIFGSYGQNYIQRAEPVIPCVGEAVPNTEIFRRLAARFGYDDTAFKVSDEELMDEAMDGTNPHFKGERPSQISTRRAIVVRAADGEDLIMCKTVKPATPSGKIELFSEDLESRFGYGVPRYEEVQRDLPFVLITPSSNKRTNATFGGHIDSGGMQVLEMNPADADEKGLVDGETVIVWNNLGQVTLRLIVTDSTRPGVLYSPKGAWRHTSETGFTSNVLIPTDIRTDIERGACYNETYVDVKRW